jgi:hypothetical protein
MEPHNRIIKTLSPDFSVWQQWPEHNIAGDVPAFMHPLELPFTNQKGSRWGVWPLYCEGYTSDIEPDVATAAKVGNPPFRTVIWNRITRTDIPQGWWQPLRKSAGLIGYIDAREGYEKHWAESARRYRRRWLTLTGIYRIETAGVEEFIDAYKKSTIYKKFVVGNDRLQDLKRQHELSSPHVEFLVVRRIVDGDIVAGHASLTSPTKRGSYYIAGFVTPEAKKDPVMLGLMDHWHVVCLARGIRYLHLGFFWQPGQPYDWKGFSEFKGQFSPQYIKLPPTLIRFLSGRLF